MAKIARALWAEFIRNPKVYALLLGQPVLLISILYLTDVATDPRWRSPAAQLEILRTVIVILALTHLVVAIAMAAVRVRGRAPGGSVLEVGP